MILPDRDLDEDVDACSNEHPRVPRLVWGEEGEHSSSDRDRDGVVNKGGHHQGDMRRLAEVPEEEFTDELAKLDGTKKTTVSASSIKRGHV